MRFGAATRKSGIARGAGEARVNEGCEQDFGGHAESVALPSAGVVARLAAARAWLAGHRWFSLTVLLPVALATLYYGLIASDIYVSESRFVIQIPGQKPIQTGVLGALLSGGTASLGHEQADEVVDYLKSRNALSDLQKRIDVHARYAGAGADPFSRYPSLIEPDRFETLYKYYAQMVSVDQASDTSSVVLRVQAFSPADARDINAKLLDLSEELVNRLNQRAQHRAIAEAEARVTQAEQRARAARLALAEYRNRNDLLDPAKQATGAFDVSNHLEADRAALQANLDLMQKVAPLNPTIPSLRTRVNALSREIDLQNGRAVGTSSGIASRMAGYEKLVAEQDFATAALASANTALEVARTDAAKQEFYLERVVQPNTPDLGELPHRFWRVLTVALVALGLYLIGWMLIVGILEHAPEN